MTSEMMLQHFVEHINIITSVMDLSVSIQNPTIQNGVKQTNYQACNHRFSLLLSRPPAIFA